MRTPALCVIWLLVLAGTAFADDVPPGTVLVPGGDVWVGTDAKRLSALLAGHPDTTIRVFAHEAPRHRRTLSSYFISKHEVTNAQYRRFLQDHAGVYDTTSGGLANVDEIAGWFLGLTPRERAFRSARAWKQLYFANKQALWKALAARLDAIVLRLPDGEIDEDKTAEAFRYEPLPRGIRLRFYRLRPPVHWPDMDPTPAERDHPVRYVSYNDAERFAEWAGAHIPTEFEWEYAARGPDERVYPWGDVLERQDERLNWNSRFLDARYEPTTTPVGSLPRGRSWCGCEDMQGNVSEWTSSDFAPYPGNDRRNTYMNGELKVVRGAAAPHRNHLMLRSAARHWGGNARPRPRREEFYRWVGFRLALYPEPGRDQLMPVVRRATRAGYVKTDALDLDRFGGAVARNWAPAASRVEDHVYVLGRAHAIVLVPLESYLQERGVGAVVGAWRQPRRRNTTREIERGSRTKSIQFPLAVVHSDIPLYGVDVVTPGQRARTAGRARRPASVTGSAKPATYVLAHWHGGPCLATPDHEPVAFLPATETQVEVVSIDPDERPKNVFALDVEGARVDFELWMPLGGRRPHPKTYVHVRGRLPLQDVALRRAGMWR